MSKHSADHLHKISFSLSCLKKNRKRMLSFVKSWLPDLTWILWLFKRFEHGPRGTKEELFASESGWNIRLFQSGIQVVVVTSGYPEVDRHADSFLPCATDKRTLSQPGMGHLSKPVSTMQGVSIQHYKICQAGQKKTCFRPATKEPGWCQLSRWSC